MLISGSRTLDVDIPVGKGVGPVSVPCLCGECAVSTVFGGKCASSVVLTGDSVRDLVRSLVLEAIVPCGAALTEELSEICLSIGL